MSVHQLPDGRWFVQYRVGKKYRREYFGRGLDAEKAARQRSAVVLLQRSRSVERVTPEEGEHEFWELCNEYMKARYSNMEASTLDRMRYKFESVIFPVLGHLDVRELSPEHMDAFVNRRLGQGLSRTTVHGDVTLIQSVVNWALRRGHLFVNPLAGYEKLKRDDAVIQPATQDELNKILRKSPPQLKRAVLLSYYTGLRPGRAELFALKWTDVDWTGETILVRSAKKHGPRARTIPIHPSLLPLLRKWWRADGKSQSEIITFDGHPITTLRRSWATAKKEAGITRRFPPYAIRHAFVTNLLSSGADLKATSEIAGHSRPDTTMRVYHHTDLAAWRRSIEKLPSLDRKPGKSKKVLPKN